MSEPVRPKELWGLWNNEFRFWYGSTERMLIFFESKDQADVIWSRRPDPHNWRVVPVPARLDAPPAPAPDQREIVVTREIRVGIPNAAAAAALSAAGYLVLSPEELKERTGQ